ncbi:MAG TPA: NAD(P)H-dependent oxidoreductase [Methylibium sp.]|uniref:glutathione-regulated potassium-efflux system oxidoreductase KefF n=1 Tax=Methylibium sp. TaxID=2067992 RepID=UPI002DBDE7BD|nr:NAD(P)H-dependent oxidoreductase [Methylibium sp.]HEU4459820.1 NAD(P)H-dependent oxidoreductase [Methylibium sp.]
MARVLVLCAHPDLRQSRVNRALLKAAREVAAGPAGANSVEVRDLYALYPDYVIDVPAEQEHAARADLIVWQHPVHWYAMPPLMKLWLDDVLALGWAYGANGTALKGKDLWLVLSTGGSEAAYRPDGYNRYFFDAFLPPCEQTAALCGLRFLPPLVLHGAHTATPEAVGDHVARFVEHLRSYPAWPEMDDVLNCPACVVPANERPSDAVMAEEVTP